jgi:hypothetical protein
MALQGLVDWKGRPVNPKRHGGVKATMFIYCKQTALILLLSISIPIPTGQMYRDMIKSWYLGLTVFSFITRSVFLRLILVGN